MKRITAPTSHKMYMFTLFKKKRLDVNTRVYLRHHSLHGRTNPSTNDGEPSALEHPEHGNK